MFLKLWLLMSALLLYWDLLAPGCLRVSFMARLLVSLLLLFPEYVSKANAVIGKD